MPFLDVELARIAAIASNCDCCDVPCCNYCKVTLAWSLNGSAQREISGIRETVTFNAFLSLIFNRNQDPLAPRIPQTFRNIESPGADGCELVPNPGDGAGWLAVAPGSYSYEQKRLSDGVILDTEDIDLYPRLDAFNIGLDCDCQGTADSIFNLGLEGDPVFPETMPACWAGLPNSVRVIDNIADCSGLSTDITTTCAGWDTASLVDNLSVQIDPCGEDGLPLIALASPMRAARVRMRQKNCPTCEEGIIFQGQNPISLA